MEKNNQEFTDHINLRFSAGEGGTLRQLANELDLSLSELIRLLVGKGLTEMLREVGHDNAASR